MSIIVVGFVLIYLNWRLQVMLSYERDEYMMCSFFTDFNERDPYKLKGGDLDFKLAIMDNTLIYDDNPYGQIKLHRYTNYESEDGTTKDEIIEMRDCDYNDDTNEEKNDLWN